jgi:putative peptide zinc metalloprotease protein
MALHELAHGLACKAHGRRVRAVGITVLDYVLPSFYVDVTDMTLSTRAGRVVVDLAGPLANLLLVTLATAVAWLTSDPWLRAVLVVVADLNVALALFTAWPFHGLQEDGYAALSELLRVSVLRRRAGALLQAVVGKAPAGLDRPRGPAALYLAGLALTWGGLGLALGLWLTGRLAAG